MVVFGEPLQKLKAHEIFKDNIDLFQAVKNNDLDAILAAVIRDQPFNVKDKNGNNLLHAAVKNANRSTVRAILKFSSQFELWSLKNNEGKFPQDLSNEANIKKDINAISTIRPSQKTHNCMFNKLLVEKRIKEPKENYKTLLSLDGGGIRVLLQCSILLEIERTLGAPLNDHLHWMGGTSCGGIMSAALSCGTRIGDAFKIFLMTRKRVFCGNTRMFPKHNPMGVESLLREVFGHNTHIGKVKAHKLVMTTARVLCAPPQLILFRSYAPKLTTKEFEQLGYLDPNKVLLWKALRCTSAAPLYFSSYNGMADGAIFCNNPCIMLMTEFTRLRKIESYHGTANTDEIGCVISIGTGMEPNSPINGIDINVTNAFTLTGNFREILANGKNLITLFMYQCTTSHNVHVGQSREWAHSLCIPFFRFSPRLSTALELDTCKLDAIIDKLFETEIYIKTQIQTEIHDLCRLLKALPKNLTPVSYTDITTTKTTKTDGNTMTKKKVAN